MPVQLCAFVEQFAWNQIALTANTPKKCPPGIRGSSEKSRIPLNSKIPRSTFICKQKVYLYLRVYATLIEQNAIFRQFFLFSFHETQDRNRRICHYITWIDNNEIIASHRNVTAHAAEWHWNMCDVCWNSRNWTIKCVILLCLPGSLWWMNKRTNERKNGWTRIKMEYQRLNEHTLNWIVSTEYRDWELHIWMERQNVLSMALQCRGGVESLAVNLNYYSNVPI